MNIHIEPSSVSAGTRLIGYVSATYDQLIETFESPETDVWNESTCQWTLNLDGEIVTIYDYNTYQTPTDEYEWSIGGNSPRGLIAMINALDKLKLKLLVRSV